MQVINWLALQPLPDDLDALRERLHVVLPVRSVCQLLVETTLRAYPWAGRADLISCYHPSQTYKQGQKIALLIPDSQKVHPTVWQLAQVKQTKLAENPVQGRFQVLTVEIQGRQIQMAGGIADAFYAEPDLPRYTPEDLAWLVKWVSDMYATPLLAILKKLIQKGEICGGLAGEIFLPERVTALSPELLDPLMNRVSPARPWISLEEIFRNLPDLSPLKRETVLPLLHAALQEGPYRSLGAGRWTTPELFNQLNREVPLGLPTPRIPSSMPFWTKQDEKDLAGYDKKFMPTEARQALEELGIVERRPAPDESPWRPPKGPVRLPALSYLHMTQAYFPVGDVRRAFAPGVQLVFVQLINGDHQPFLLDREHGLLKPIHPEALHTSILKAGLPAGTYLWLEYEGDEKYRIAPRPLPFKRMVTCKLAHFEDRHLHVQHTQISMMYEGQPSLFKASMGFEEFEALSAEAGRVDLSLRDALTFAIQELCATDPDHRAHRLDIFNAVFLQRMCSPGSIAVLLYTHPCFEQLEGSYFRYKPMPDEPLRKTRKRRDRLSKLWDNLLSNAVAPNPVPGENTSVGGRFESRYPIFPTPDLELSSFLRESETSVSALPLVIMEEDTAGQTALQEEIRIEMLLPNNDKSDALTPMDAAEPVGTSWSDKLGRLLHSLEERVTDEPSAPYAEEAASESEALSDASIEAAHEESLSFSSPFRWDPQPAWVDVPTPPKHPLPDAADVRRLVYRPKIPSRPLHKQPLHRRIFFYLRIWLSRIFRKAI